MQKNQPMLFVEINYKSYVFIAGVYDDNQSFRLLEKIITDNEGITKNKLSDINKAQEIIKKSIQTIEKKLDYIFKDIIIIIDFFEYFSLNLSGFKKLNGSQVLEENISYIINSLKQNVNENERENTILHIFNSRSTLDGTSVENLPIGLYGNFYNHELTFFMMNKNDFKNINNIFNKIDLKVKKILLKDYVEGIDLINDQKTESFYRIKINRDRSQVSVFENSSFRYIEHFNFGTDVILRDIMKICSVKREFINQILFDRMFKNRDFKDNDSLEQKYFDDINYRKIKKKLICDIANARIQEIVNIIFNNNISLNFFKKKIKKIYISIEDDLVSDNFYKDISFYFLINQGFELDLINSTKTEQLTFSVANLLIYGWKKEAIPIVQSKNSIIARIFKALFS